MLSGQAGQSVLFHAAAGGVGLLAGQWGKDLGARMIGVAGGPDKCKLALANGYDVCLDRKSDDIAARTKELTGGKGVPVVFDSVGKDSFEASLNSLAPRGFLFLLAKRQDILRRFWVPPSKSTAPCISRAQRL